MALLQIDDASVAVTGRRLLQDVRFTVDAGECVALAGPSGVGKTSLLNCVAGIAALEAGTILIDGVELTRLGPAGRADFRLRHVGMVFQYGELVAELSALENIALPSRLMGIPRHEAETRAGEWLERFGLSQHTDSLPESLSGGEVQRIGIARALAHNPRVVLADEPTGMLDEENTERVTSLLVQSAKDLNAAVLVVTHDPTVAAAADRVLRIRSGRVVPAPQSLIAEEAAS